MIRENRAVLGKKGEEIARLFLERKGLRVLAQNYRCSIGEMDLVCMDGDEFVFVEVKTRGSLDFGDGAEAVDARKREKLIKIALHYLKGKKSENSPFRFDVVSILRGKEERINHIPHAF